jgi:predicted peroxiredoxin
MAKLVYLSTYGSDDPTRAAMPFYLANGAIEAGHEAEISLTGEAVYLMKDAVVDAVQPVGWPSLRELFDKVVEAGVTIDVCRRCADARDVSEVDLEGKNARFTSPETFANICAGADQVIGG